jgi:chromosome partitioning protein
MSKIISISNHKGGIGKTTTTVNLGAALLSKGFKVLLVDLDHQAHLTCSLGIKKTDITIYDNMVHEKPVAPVNYRSTLDVIPSCLDLSVAEMEMNQEPGREFILKDILTPLKDIYDYILIDCPPSLGLLTLNAFAASDEILIPLTPEYLPLKGLTALNAVVHKVQKRLNKNLKILGVVLTKYDARKILHRDIEDAVKKHFGDSFLRTKISDNIALAEAPSQGKDIFLYNKSCKGASDYLSLCEEILEKRVI